MVHKSPHSTRPVLSRTERRALVNKLDALVQQRDRLDEDILIAIYEGRRQGLSQSDIAYGLGHASPSAIADKAARGKALLEARKGKTG